MSVMLSDDTISDTAKVVKLRTDQLSELVENLDLLIENKTASRDQIRYRDYINSILEG